VDISGEPFWRKVSAIIHSATKAGYLEYDWKNPNEAKERKKTGYVTYFEPMDLIIWAST